MSIKKKYSKSKGICKVTFDLPESIGDDVQKVYVVGEFNNWSTTATPMKRQKNGSFRATLDLPKDHEYQFRYFLDNGEWENESDADKYAETPYADSENSVIVL